MRAMFRSQVSVCGLLLIAAVALGGTVYTLAVAPAPPPKGPQLGDVNFDGVVDLYDVPAVVQAFDDPLAWTKALGVDYATLVAVADYDNDGLFGKSDLDGLCEVIAARAEAATSLLPPGLRSTSTGGLRGFLDPNHPCRGIDLDVDSDNNNFIGTQYPDRSEDAPDGLDEEAFEDVGAAKCIPCAVGRPGLVSVALEVRHFDPNFIDPSLGVQYFTYKLTCEGVTTGLYVYRYSSGDPNDPNSYAHYLKERSPHCFDPNCLDPNYTDPDCSDPQCVMSSALPVEPTAPLEALTLAEPNHVFTFQAWRVGDVNGDGALSFGDINPFVAALVSPAEWQREWIINPTNANRWHPEMLPRAHLITDVNFDGVTDFGDINVFVDMLVNPANYAPRYVPEWLFVEVPDCDAAGRYTLTASIEPNELAGSLCPDPNEIEVTDSVALSASDPNGTDCNANGVDDWCEVLNWSVNDCDADGIMDACEDPNEFGGDCNGNGRPDLCDIVCPLDIVFIMDTSATMGDEVGKFCRDIDRAVGLFELYGYDIQAEVLRICVYDQCDYGGWLPSDGACSSRDPEVPCDCCEDYVQARYYKGQAYWSPPLKLCWCDGAGQYCHDGELEDWGPAAAVVAEGKKPLPPDPNGYVDPHRWRDGAVRAIVVLSDEAPRFGYPFYNDPSNQSNDAWMDSSTIRDALPYLQENNVVFSAIIGDGADPNMYTWASILADGAAPGGIVTDAGALEISVALRRIVHSACRASQPDCNGDGIPDWWDVSVCGNDLNQDDIPDDCQTRPYVEVWRDGSTISTWNAAAAVADANASECEVLRLVAWSDVGDPASQLYEWDLDFDVQSGFSADVFGPEFEYAWRSATEAEEHVVAVRLRDAQGGHSAIARARLSIADGEPAITSLPGPNESTELWVNQPGCFVASVACACDDVVSVEWDFGDQTETGLLPAPEGLEQCHAWSDPNAYTVTCTVHDSDGDTATTECSVWVIAGGPPYEPKNMALQVERQQHVYDPEFINDGQLWAPHSAEMRLVNAGDYPVRGPVYLAFENLTPVEAVVVGPAGDPNVGPGGSQNISVLEAEQTLPAGEATDWLWVEWQIPAADASAFGFDAVPYARQLPPVFTSTAPGSATEGQWLVYEAHAVDPEGESVFYELCRSPECNDPPEGMHINSASGRLTWYVGDDQDGSYAITIRARDSYSWTDQVMSLVVEPVNAPPVITEAPALVAQLGQPYLSRIVVTDPEEPNDPNITLTSYTVPSGMVVSNTGAGIWELTWSAASGVTETLEFEFTDDGQGAALPEAVSATYTLEIVNCATGRPRLVRDEPGHLERAIEGQPYLKQMRLDDPNAPPVYYFLDLAPSGMTISAEGLIQWLPPYTAAGPQIVRVRADTDSFGEGACFDTYAFNILVDNRNAAPLVTSCPPTLVDEGEFYLYPVTAEDPDGDRLEYRLLDGPPGMRIEPTGLLHWRPSQTAAGESPYDVHIQVRDAAGVGALVPEDCSVALEYELSVLAVNVAPIFTSHPLTDTPVGQVYVYPLRAYDPDGDAVAFHLLDGPPEMDLLLDGNNPRLEWLPESVDANKAHTIRVSATDTSGRTAEQPFVLRVFRIPQPNQPPTLQEPHPSHAATADVAYETYVTAEDPDWDPNRARMTFELIDPPSGIEFDPNWTVPDANVPNRQRWQVTWGPTSTDIGQHYVTCRILDDQQIGFTYTWSLYVFPASGPNRAPRILNEPTFVATVDHTYRYELNAYDPDGDALHYSIVPAPEGGPGGPLVNPPDGFVINGNGVVTWTPASDQVGLHWVSAKVADAIGAEDGRIWPIWVSGDDGGNTPPRITSVPLRQAKPGALYEYKVEFQDPDYGDTHTFELTRHPVGADINPVTGVITWVPTEAQEGTHEFCARVTDAAGAWAEQPYNVAVTPLGDNAPPWITSAPVYAVEHGNTYSYCIEVEDEEPNGLVYMLVQGPPDLDFAQTPRNCLAWNTTSAALGVYTVVVRVTDIHGAWAEQPFPLTVWGGSAPPVIASTPWRLATIGEEWTYEVRATDDGDPNDLVFQVRQYPVGTTLSPDSCPTDPIAQCATFTWTPSSFQAGVQQFVVRVTDVEGNWVEQPFDVVASTDGANHAPTIASTPPTTVRLGQTYVYDVAAMDADPGDELTYSLRPLPTTPAALHFDAVQPNRLVWATSGTSNDPNIGAYPVIVRVTDTAGASDEQGYWLAVADPNSTNHPPVFLTDSPDTTAQVGQEYTIVLVGYDPDGDALEFSTLTPDANQPEWLDTTRAEFRWTPLYAGRARIEFGLSDGLVQVTKVLEIPVLGSGGNEPPRFTSVPVTTMKIGDPNGYRYEAHAEDDEDPNLLWSLVAPTAGMAVEQHTGVVTRDPNVPLEPGFLDVTVRAEDSQEAYALQPYSIYVRENLPPEILSEPARRVIVDTPYTYEIIANDEDSPHAALVYEIAWDGHEPELPGNMTLDANHRVTWTPGESEVGSYKFVVTVLDEVEAADTQTFTIRVVSGAEADLLAPLITITADPNIMDFNTADPNVTVTVTVQDDRPVAGRPVSLQATAPDSTLIWGPNDVTLETNGQYTTRIPVTGPGHFTFEASFQDEADHLRTARAVVVAYDDPNYNDANDVELTDPHDYRDSDNFAVGIKEVSGRYPVRGRAWCDGFRKWTLTYESLERPGSDAVEFASGYEPVTNEAELAVFDTTLLPNGMYRIALTAWPLQGSGYQDSATVVVTGEAKIGHFELTFTDLEVPVGGIPIRVMRTYDSRVKTKGDFGIGWDLELASLTAQENTDMALDWPVWRGGFTCGVGESVSHAVSVTLPGQRTEYFALRLNAPEREASIGGCLDIPVYGVSFERISPGTSELWVVGPTPDGVSAQSAVLGWPDGEDVAPWVPDGYTLKTGDGAIYEFARRAGRTLKLSKATDRNGNVLEIDDNHIVSNGIAVQIHRDDHGRVDKVVDPDGNAITYHYIGEGKLLDHVVDREGGITRFTYDYTNTLVEIIDPRGVPVARNEYDESGRLIQTTDALGRTTVFAHDVEHSIETITDRNGHRTQHTYDEQGNVTETVRFLPDPSYPTDPNHTIPVTTSYTYVESDGIPVLKETTDALSRIATNKYEDVDNNPDKVTTETDFEGRVTHYTYNDLGQVLTVTREGAGTTTNVYDPDTGNLMDVTDPNGVTTYYTYDEFGSVRSVKDALLHETLMTYDERGRLETQTDPNGHVTTYTYGDQQQWVTRTRKVGETIEEITSYTETDLNGRVTRQVDPLGHETVTTYTPGGQVETVTDVNGTTTYVYNDRGELEQVTYPDLNGSTETYTYDDGGRRDSVTDRDRRQVKSVYDWLDRQTRTLYVDPNDSDPNAWPFTETVYDDIGRVTSRFDENRSETQYEYLDYQTLGSGLEPGFTQQIVTNVDPNDPNNTIVTTYDYDLAGRLAKMTDNAGKETTYEYDIAGRLWKTIFHNGTYTQSTYDAVGRKIAERDPNGVVTHFDYDALGRLVRVRDAYDNPTTYEYDEVGNLTKITDAEQHETTMQYDKLGRLTYRTLPSVTEQPDLWEWFGYDDAGNLAQHRLFDGRDITYKHDSDGRMTEKTTPEGTCRYGWTPGGLLKWVDADLNVPGQTDYTYDFRGRLVQEARANDDQLRYAYDAGGNRTAVEVWPRTATGPRNGPTWKTVYEYDALNRLRFVRDVRFDPNNPSTVLENRAIATYDYDAVGNLKSVRHRDDPNTAFIDETTTSVEYTYDDLHRLTQVTNTNAGYGVISSYMYTLGAAGQRERVEERSGTKLNRTVEYEYDSLYRLTSERARTRGRPYEPNEVAFERLVKYTYDNVGNRRTMTVTETDYSSTPAVAASYTVTYTYDARDRLVSEERSGTCLSVASVPMDGERYATGGPARHLPSAWAGVLLLGFGGATLVLVFVPFGTLRGRVGGRRAYRRRFWVACVGMFFVPQFMVGAGTLLDLNTEALEAQALAAALECDQVVTYEYDLNGNLYQRFVDEELSERYVYDSENRLVAFDPAPPVDPNTYSAGATLYTYDHDGVRTSATTDGNTTHYLVDKNRDLPQVLEERDPNGVLLVRYIYGHDLLAQVRPNASGGEDTWYYHYDGQLSTRQLTKQDPGYPAVVKNRYTYDAFGAELHHAGLTSGSELVENAYRYTGEQLDAATGFYYLRARYYDPATGRFASRDPARGSQFDPVTLNAYLYANAGPIGNFDPTGEFTVSEVGVVSFIRAVLFTLNLYSLVQNVRFAVANSFSAVHAFSDGDFWDGLAYTIMAVLNGTFAVLSALGLRASLFTPSPPAVGQHMLSLAGGGTLTAGRIWAVAASSSVVMEWILKHVAVTVFVAFLAFFQSQVQAGSSGGGGAGGDSGETQGHHKVPWNNKTFAHQKHPLVKQADVNLKRDPKNQMLLGNHAGRHSRSYQEAIQLKLDRGYEKVAGKGSEAARQELSRIYGEIEREIESGTLTPYKNKDVWIPKQ